MKKIFALFLMFLSIFSSVSLAEASPPSSDGFVDEFWGIPWGISVEEFQKIAPKRIGATFSPYTDEDSAFTWYNANFCYNVNVLGYPVHQITAFFTVDTSSLDQLSIDLSVYAVEESDKVIDMFYQIYLYASLEHSPIRPPFIYFLDDITEKPIHVKLPMNASGIDKEKLMVLFKNEEILFIIADFEDFQIVDMVGYRKKINKLSHSLSFSIFAPDSSRRPTPSLSILEYEEYLDCTNSSKP